jgi:hypothetical protein
LDVLIGSRKPSVQRTIASQVVIVSNYEGWWIKERFKMKRSLILGSGIAVSAVSIIIRVSYLSENRIDLHQNQ